MSNSKKNPVATDGVLVEAAVRILCDGYRGDADTAPWVNDSLVDAANDYLERCFEANGATVNRQPAADSDSESEHDGEQSEEQDRADDDDDPDNADGSGLPLGLR